MSQPVTGIPNLPMILLKKRICALPPDVRRLLTSFLSTFYGLSMVAQGTAAVLAIALNELSDDSESPLIHDKEMRDLLSMKSSLLLSDIQDLTKAISDLELSLEDRQL